MLQTVSPDEAIKIFLILYAGYILKNNFPILSSQTKTSFCHVKF
jgi:hypothetical protein